MIVAKLSQAGMDDRHFSLEPGQHRLGSDFACEIALIHPSVAPEHLTLDVGEDSVSILPADGAVVMLFKHSVQQAISLPPGQWTRWYLGDRLMIADISIELDGIGPEEQPRRPHVGEGLFEGALPRTFFAAAFLLVLTGLVNLLFSHGLESPGAAHAEPQRAVPGRSALGSSVKSPADAAQIRKELEALGARVKTLAYRGGKWHAELRVRDAAARERLQAKLADSSLPLSAEIHVDKEIAEAAALIVSNLRGGSRVLGCQDGVVTLSAIDDASVRRKLVDTLKSDVPGIAGVRFEHTSPPDLSALAERVSGVWPGAYPYVVLDDGAIVRPGETIGQGAKLVTIARRYLLVEVHGQQKKVVME